MDTPEKILNAVLGVVEAEGISGMSVEGVAEAAGVSRQTVYRHFTNRERLIEAAIVREERVLLNQMLEAANDEATLEVAIEVAVRTALALTRAHPVLSRLLDREPAALLPYLLLGRGPVISAAEPAVSALMQTHRPHAPPTRLQLVADMSTRLLVSYVVSPHEDIPDEAIAGQLAVMVAALLDQ